MDQSAGLNFPAFLGKESSEFRRKRDLNDPPNRYGPIFTFLMIHSQRRYEGFLVCHYFGAGVHTNSYVRVAPLQNEIAPRRLKFQNEK